MKESRVGDSVLPEGSEETQSCSEGGGRGSELCPGSRWGGVPSLPLPVPSLSPFNEQISRRQSQVDRLYVALKELGEERRVGLEQQYWLYQLSRQVDELEHWIAEKEVVAGSPELGQDFEHVTVSSIRNKHDPGATVSATKVLRPSVSPPITGRL